MPSELRGQEGEEGGSGIPKLGYQLNSEEPRGAIEFDLLDKW